MDDPALPIDPDLDPSDPSGPALGPARTRPHQHRLRPDVLAAIGLGGMVGATARSGVAQWLPSHPGRFPWATFWTNLSGSFLLGLLLAAILARPPSPRAEPDSGRSTPPAEVDRPQSSVRRLVRPFAATGILGAFTTMSTFQVESAQLLRDGHAPTAVVYLATSLVIGLAAAYAGIITGREIHRRGAATRRPERA